MQKLSFSQARWWFRCSEPGLEVELQEAKAHRVPTTAASLFSGPANALHMQEAPTQTHILASSHPDSKPHEAAR